MPRTCVRRPTVLVLCLFCGLIAAEQDADSPLLALPGFSFDQESEALRYGESSVAFLGTNDSRQAERDRERLTTAIDAFATSLDDSTLGDLSRRSLLAFLALLPGEDPEGAPNDEIYPSFARLLVHHGWLEKAIPDLGSNPQARRLRQATARTLEPSVAASWQGDTVIVYQIADSWGRGGFVVHDRQNDHTWLFMRPPLPFYHRPGRFAETWLRLALDPARQDRRSLLEAIEPQRLAATTDLRLLLGDDTLAKWSTKDGFSVNQRQWRRAFPVRGSTTLPDHFPPHLPLGDLQGGFHALILPEGILRPPADDNEAAAEAFLDQAAALLPTVAHLDLLGNYMVKYVYDSPDPTLPNMIGNRDLHADIHQTARETLTAITAGICRGDCDDLSELYLAIAERQDRLAHMALLPGHAAMATAEEDDGRWRVVILQTGPGLAFTADTLPEALEQAFKSFDPTSTFDPDGIPLLLRFSGENTRGPWRLSWRIYRDADYAETMIDIQRDWHYQTYLQGIEKMLALVAAGDDDTANLRELAGLYAFTGQWEQYRRYQEAALEKTEQPQNQIELMAEMAGQLAQAGHRDEAQALIRTIVEDRLPTVREDLGIGMVQLGSRLAHITTIIDEAPLGLEILRQTGLGPAMQIARQLAQLIKQDLHQQHEVWVLNSQVRAMRQLVSSTMQAAMAVLEKHPEPEDEPEEKLFGQVRAVVDAWLAEIAFAGVDEPAQTLGHYAAVARLWIADTDLDTVLAKVEEASFPAETEIDHRALANRREREAQLPWIKLSLPFFSGLIRERCIDTDGEQPDPAFLRRLDAALQAANAETLERGIKSPQLRSQTHTTQVILAMVLEDEPRLRALLREVARLNDKRWRDSTAQLMGDVAPLVSPRFFQRALQVWVDEVDYKAKYFWIAWRAALAGATEHALMTAAVAARRFPDEPTFAAEEQFMRELLKP